MLINILYIFFNFRGRSHPSVLSWLCLPPRWTIIRSWCWCVVTSRMNHSRDVLPEQITVRSYCLLVRFPKPNHEAGRGLGHGYGTGSRENHGMVVVLTTTVVASLSLSIWVSFNNFHLGKYPSIWKKSRAYENNISWNAEFGPHPL